MHFSPFALIGIEVIKEPRNDDVARFEEEIVGIWVACETLKDVDGVDNGILSKDVRVTKGTPGIAGFESTDRCIESSFAGLGVHKGQIVPARLKVGMKSGNTFLKMCSTSGVIGHEADALVEVGADVIPTE